MMNLEFFFLFLSRFQKAQNSIVPSLQVRKENLLDSKMLFKLRKSVFID